jgi:diaminopimelate decarboxylase
MYGSYHHIFVNGKIGENESEKYDIVGPICESGDFFAKDRSMPKIEEGDLLIIMTAGAYGYSMSSTYNLRPRAAEILINNSEISEIRKRETIKELMKNQI